MYSYSFANFYWWLADNPYLTTGTQFIDAKGIDIRNNAPTIRPQVWLTAWFALTSTTKLYCAVDWFGFGDNWKVYWLPTGVEVYNAGSYNIKAVTKFNGMYIWWAEASGAIQVGKILVSETSWATTWVWQPSVDAAWHFASDADWTGNDQNDTSCRIPIVKYGRKLFWANKNWVFVADTANLVEVWLSNLEADVMWLTNEWSRICVFLANWQKLFRDWGSENIQEVKKYPFVIRHVYDAGDFSYVVAGTWVGDDQLFMSAGYDMKLLKDQSTNIFITRTESGSQNWFTSYNNITYFLGKSATQWVAAESGMYMIYSHWSYNSSLPQSVNLEWYKTDNGNYLKQAYMLHEYAGVLYVCYYDLTATEYWIDKVTLQILQDNTKWGLSFTGGGSPADTYITPHIFDWGKGQRNIKKRLKKIEFVGNLTNAGWWVTIKYQKTDDLGQGARKYLLEYWYSTDTRATLATIDNVDATSRQRIVDTTIDIEFYSIIFKIIFTDTDASLTQFIIYYDEVADVW